MTRAVPAEWSGRCRDCHIGCRQKKGAKKNKLAAYAALWGFEPNQPGLDEFVAAYHRGCDDIGLEAFETAAAIALGLKAGLVGPDFSGILKALEEINRGTELGFILGRGGESAALAWDLPLPAENGPRKSTGLEEAEELFLDSVGLCAFAYSVMLNNAELWAALEDLLKAKYGPSFDPETLNRPAV